MKKTEEFIHQDSISLKNYFKDIRKIEMVNGDDQLELFKKAKGGDTKALNKLVESNLRFVLSVAKEYQYTGVPLEDLISEGNLGLIKAVSKFDDTRDIKFISYAVWWIRQSILQSVYDNESLVRLPVNKINAKNKITRAIEALSKETREDSTYEEISKMADVDIKEVEDAFKFSYTKEVSLSSTIDEESGSELHEMIESPSFDEMQAVMNKEGLGEEIKNVFQENLNEREELILKMYFGLDGYSQMTLKEIGDAIDLTNERVRQIKEFALKKLRTFSKSSRLREFLND